MNNSEDDWRNLEITILILLWLIIALLLNPEWTNQ